MGVLNDIEYEWMFWVDGKEVSVKTKQNNETLGKIELAKSLTGVENENNALKRFYELEKKRHIEYKGVAPVRILVKY